MLVSLCISSKLWICGEVIEEVMFVDSEKIKLLALPYPNSAQQSFSVHILRVLASAG